MLQFDSIESLTKDWIEGKVTSLSYEGFGDLEDWCQSRGIPILVPEGRRENIVELIATRNLIVHNRGLVDERYRKVAPKTRFGAGELRKLVVEDLISAKDLLDHVVTVTDGAVVGKFGLTSCPLREELKCRAERKWPRKEEPERNPADKQLANLPPEAR